MLLFAQEDSSGRTIGYPVLRASADRIVWRILLYVRFATFCNGKNSNEKEVKTFIASDGLSKFMSCVVGPV